MYLKFTPAPEPAPTGRADRAAIRVELHEEIKTLAGRNIRCAVPMVKR
jgi:hypothetical protein